MIHTTDGRLILTPFTMHNTEIITNTFVLYIAFIVRLVL